MKIKRVGVKASSEIVEAGCKYQQSIELIKCAIESLAEAAQTDEVAKDSIANLSVVLLDLKGACGGVQ